MKLLEFLTSFCQGKGTTATKHKTNKTLDYEIIRNYFAERDQKPKFKL